MGKFRVLFQGQGASHMHSHVVLVDYEYRIIFYTSKTAGSGTTSEVFLKLYGQEASDRERWFGNQSRQLAADGSVTQFKLRAHQSLGELTKVKIGLEGKGSSPGWLLDKVRLLFKLLRGGARWVMKRCFSIKIVNPII